MDYLRHAGLEPWHAVDGQAALEIAASWRPDLVVLDLMLPGASGLEVCRRLREEQDTQAPLPVIMLTALGEESDRVGGSRAAPMTTSPSRSVRGSSSCGFRPSCAGPRRGPVCRPPRSRCARDAGGRRGGPPRPPRRPRAGPDRARVRPARLLRLHPGRAFTRAELLEQVWGWSFGDLSTITVYVRRLREKVEQEPAAPAQLQTVWGVGYRWEADPP